jgi:hypothetical protein
MYSDLKNQHDFMENRSKITNLLEYVTFVLDSIIEDGNQIDSIYTEKKVFYRLRHQLLLNEMSVGIELARYMWLGSYG